MRRTRIIAGILVVLVVLVGCSHKPTAEDQKAQCFASQKLIETEMRLFKADSGLDAPLQNVLDATHAVCPSGGTYSYDATTELASCTVHGHY